MTTVAVLDYGMGNLHSVAKALEHVGAEVIVTNQPQAVKSADKILFPGVGAMRDCMKGMEQAGIDEVVREAVFNKPVMAICVGMQALFDYSTENFSETKHEATPCLGILKGSVQKFDENWTDNQGERIKIPHMGWNTLAEMDLSHPLWQGIDEHSYFYFVHSFYCQPDDKNIIAGVCDYGKPFCASVIQDNLFATQFHPEKSHTNGLRLLKNFVEWKV